MESIRAAIGRFVGLSLMCLYSITAFGQFGDVRLETTPNPNVWVTDGEVYAVECTPKTVYLGGKFSCVGSYVGSGVPLSMTSGEPAAVYPKANGKVYACIPDGSGGWFIGGSFTQVGRFSRGYLAHILANNTVDPDWKPSAYLPVRALALSGSTLYIGGDFSSVNGVKRWGLAAVDSATGNLLPWAPTVARMGDSYAGNVYALAVAGTTVYVGGDFDNINHITHYGVAAIDGQTGTPDSWNAGSTGVVKALAVSGSTLYVGGTFTNIGGVSRNYIAAFDSSHKLLGWNPSLNGAVNTMQVSGSNLYIGGDFTSAQGKARKYAVAADLSTANITGWDPNANGSVASFATSGSKLFVGGAFTTIGGKDRSCIAELDLTSGTASAWNSNLNASVDAIAVSGSVVYAGGEFNIRNPVKRSNLAALDAATGAATSWNPGANDTVNDLATTGTRIFATGRFTSIGGRNIAKLAALDMTTNTALAWNPQATGWPECVAVYGNMVFFGGQAATVSGQPVRGLLAVDANTGALLNWNPNLVSGGTPYVERMAISGSTLYISGSFSYITYNSRNGVGAINIPTATATGWNPSCGSATIKTLTCGSSKVYAGGIFFYVGSVNMPYLVGLDPVTGSIGSGWNSGCNGQVQGSAYLGSTLYIGGGFGNVGGQPRNKIAALDGTTGLAKSWAPDANNMVMGMAASGSSLYVYGVFDVLGGQPQYRFARFDRYTPAGDWEWYQ